MPRARGQTPCRSSRFASGHSRAGGPALGPGVPSLPGSSASAGTALWASGALSPLLKLLATAG